MCQCVYVYVCIVKPDIQTIHRCSHTSIHTYRHTHTHTHTYIHTHTYTYIHTYIHTHTYTHIHTYTHTYIHTHTHTYIHTYIHTYTTHIRYMYMVTHSCPGLRNRRRLVHVPMTSVRYNSQSLRSDPVTHYFGYHKHAHARALTIHTVPYCNSRIAYQA